MADKIGFSRKEQVNDGNDASHRYWATSSAARVAERHAVGRQSSRGGSGHLFWTDWTNGTSSPSGFVGAGTITTLTSVVDVTYTNPQGIHFFQPSGGTDYYQNGRSGRNAATSPYTSDVVANIPTGTDIVALRFAGTQTLTFSEEIANPVFSYVSLNGNGYGFDQDFEILSFGDPSDGNDCGYFGCGTSFKNVVDLGGGNFEYQLLGTGEPHGTIRFLGAFSTVSWWSLGNEVWNGFTVGVQGTAVEIPDTDFDGVLEEDDLCPSTPAGEPVDADGCGASQLPPAPTLPTTKAECKKGGWESFGVFKNQGDCVSFVATKGKNRPAFE